MSKYNKSVSRGISAFCWATVACLGTFPSDAETRTLGSAAYLRASPNLSAAPLDELQRGAAVDAGACADGWCHVIASSGAGYVNAMALAQTTPALDENAICWIGRTTGYVAADKTRYCAEPASKH